MLSQPFTHCLQSLLNELRVLQILQHELQRYFTLLRLMRVELEKITDTFTSFEGKHLHFIIFSRLSMA